MIEPLLLAATRLSTFLGRQHLTNASGFFFSREERLFLVTSRHVVIDEPSGHLPDRIELEVHVDPQNLAASTGLSILLYQSGAGIWRDAADTSGPVDVAVLEIDRRAMPAGAVYSAFTPGHLLPPGEQVEIGARLLVVGFPLGFHDTLHHLPVARAAVLASSFGFRFQGQGYFLTDARTHRGISGAPVVMRASVETERGDLPWLLLGVHSARLDIGTRDLDLDEALGLNCSWYSDVLLPLTEAGRLG